MTKHFQEFLGKCRINAVEDGNDLVRTLTTKLTKMLAYTIETFAGRWEMTDEEMDDVIINTRWGVAYNIEQLLEHATVHVLRHRRQFDKFLLKFDTPKLGAFGFGRID